MDRQRAQAYLQAACAGLGFDIGEVWWTSSENGSSSLAAIDTGEPGSGGAANERNLRFVQLYTSRSYESRRSELVNPPLEEEEEKASNNGNNSTALQHVLSPRLVDAISQTAQVVWATTKKQEGLIGRSDIRLQTAVGMPVAMDNNGNMCVVVMFSPNNVQSTDDAMEYLHSISQSATSSSIPCLMPVFDSSNGMKQISNHPNNNHPEHQHLVPHPDPNSLGEGVSARFVSLDDSNLFRTDAEGTKTLSDEPEVHCDHDVSAAPKDTFGIPMLPSFAELGQGGKVTPDDSEDAFDEATYGIWRSIMEDADSFGSNEKEMLESLIGEGNSVPNGSASTSSEVAGGEVEKDTVGSSLQVAPLVAAPPPLKECRKERLVEFCSAFLGMSVFDLADVWVPSGANFPSDTLRHAVTVTSHGSAAAADNPLLTQFQEASERALIKYWTGAVGRAFSTGNPVWSSNANSFTDAGRMGAFQQAQFRTVLAVPVFAKSATQPACVVAAYSFVRSGSVPFVLRFVQQALRLLWDGLDHMEQPHVADNVWQNVRAADLGEMAGDVEMHQHFHAKKRSHQTMMLTSSEALHLPTENDPIPTATTAAPAPSSVTDELSSQFQSIELPNGDVITIPLHLEEPDLHSPSAPPPGSAHVHVEELQNHVNDAVRSVSRAVPQEPVIVNPVPNTEMAHINTNASGSKRAHIMPGLQASPLAPPRPLPSQIVSGHTKSVQPTLPFQAPSPPTFAIPAAPAPMPPSPPVVRATPASMPPSTPVMVGLGMPPSTAVASSILLQQPQQIPTTAAPVPQLASASAVTMTAPMMQTATAAVQPEPSPSAPFCLPVQNGGFSLGEPSSVPGKVCRIQGCEELAVSKRPYCIKHSGNRQCEHVGCNKCAQGSTRFCIAHGGGRRCTFPGCDKGARDKFFCAAHGGGKRCQFEGGCTKSAVGGSNLCTAHGGGRRCDVPGCGKSAQSSTRFCVKHGGGKKCSHEGCEKVARGRTNFCAAHGGGVRCKLDGCNRVAIGKLQLCRAHGGGSSRGSSRSSPPVPGAGTAPNAMDL